MHALFDERRYLLDFSPRAAPLPCVVTDTLVIGGGAAGLRAAIAAAEYGKVLLIAKAAPEWTNTSWAQGGVAAAMGEGDTFERHVADTLGTGAGLCDEHVVRAVVEAAPRRLEELIGWGMRFDRDAGGALALGLEGAHSAARILHAGGDATGRELTRCLLAQARQMDRIAIIDDCFAVDLVSAPGDSNGGHPPPVLGAITCDAWFGLRFLQARATVLACGGAGMVYRETSNPRFATGDGLAMAYRAGAAVADMAFVQFHPTTLRLPGMPRRLISEAVRGEGAHLVDENGARFMLDEHSLAELAPRDVVSRAIERLQRRGGRAFLDVRHLRAFAERFPGISAMLRGHGLDPTRDLIPVGPAAHFMIGGVVTDLEGRTNVPGLFAAGEVASIGLHGANRLASNSLLEGLVLGEAAGGAAARWGRENGFGERLAAPLTGGTSGMRGRALDRSFLSSLQRVMWEQAGIERSETGLRQARDHLHALAGAVMCGVDSTPEGWERQNLLLTAALIVESALWRRESRGCHWREDAPAPSGRFAVRDHRRRSGAMRLRQVSERYPGQPPAKTDLKVDNVPVDSIFVDPVLHKGAAMVSQTSEYALRAVVHLARADGNSAVAQEIAAATKVPLGYLQKILRMLARSGILQAQRGVGGGYSLARTPAEITVLDVLNATASEVSRITTCPLGIPGHTRLCALHRLLDEQAAGAERVFSQTSIQSLLQQDDSVQPLCHLPAGMQRARVNGDGGPERDAGGAGRD